MELQTFRNGNQTVKITVILSVCYCAVLTLAFIISLFFISKEIDKVPEKMLVIDTKGQVYNTSIINSSDGRIFEYKNHIRMFYSLWYSFDENNYSKNIEAGLQLIGDRGKELLNEYNDQQVAKQLAEKNLIYKVSIDNIVINMDSNPVSGKIEGIQMAQRKKGKISRTICVKFTLEDVSRSDGNVHGCKIISWDIYESHIIKEGEVQ